MNIGKLLTKTALTFPERLAIAHGKKKWTYAQFNDRANRLANALYGLGISKGDNVALDIKHGKIIVGKKSFTFPKLPKEKLSIRDAGGLLAYTRAKLKKI